MRHNGPNSVSVTCCPHFSYQTCWFALGEAPFLVQEWAIKLIFPMRKIYLIPIFFALLLGLLVADVALTDTSGNTHSGTIDMVFFGTVHILDGNGERVEIPVDQLSVDSQEVVNQWTRDNPHFVDVYSAFDQPPSPSRTNNPRNFLDRAVRSETGMVGVEIIISDAGEVLFAQVVRSSNDALNEASLRAVQEWRFNPAQVGGVNVRARIRVPLRY